MHNPSNVIFLLNMIRIETLEVHFEKTTPFRMSSLILYCFWNKGISVQQLFVKHHICSLGWFYSEIIRILFDRFFFLISHWDGDIRCSKSRKRNQFASGCNFLSKIQFRYFLGRLTRNTVLVEMLFTSLGFQHSSSLWKGV